jgi:hyperosmotically inducible protein
MKIRIPAAMRRSKKAQMDDRSRWKKAAPFLLAAAAGSAGMYFLDPARGRARRAKTKDQIAGRLRRESRRVERSARYAGATVAGKLHGAVQGDGDEEFDPRTIEQKVSSELLGAADIPKGRININVEDGTLVLRGMLDTPDEIREVEKRARRIDGVERVENLLHLPDTPAPNKA